MFPSAEGVKCFTLESFLRRGFLSPYGLGAGAGAVFALALVFKPAPRVKCKGVGSPDGGCFVENPSGGLHDCSLWDEEFALMVGLGAGGVVGDFGVCEDCVSDGDAGAGLDVFEAEGLLVGGDKEGAGLREGGEADCYGVSIAVGIGISLGRDDDFRYFGADFGREGRVDEDVEEEPDEGWDGVNGADEDHG